MITCRIFILLYKPCCFMVGLCWLRGKVLGMFFPDFVIVSPKNLHQRVWRFSDALPSTWFGCKPPCSEVA